MRYGEKVHRALIRKSRGRELVVEVPKIVEPDDDHKMYEEEAAKAAGIPHLKPQYMDRKLPNKIKNSGKIIAKTQKDAIAGAHILSALHMLYGIYKQGMDKHTYSPERLAEKIGHVVDSEDEKHFKKAVGFFD
ncbi:hypothetical protein [Thermococcus stetteri]|uniref:hypothetical protein n=1 Tax=Thermococcus stetteri TaxID=49900 RepID=UPI001AE70029|nr:hypothetical protein [Thermococcus stetteri]